MMRSNLYLVFGILFVFVVCSTSIDQQSQKGNSALDSKKKAEPRVKEDKREKYRDRGQDQDQNKDEDDVVDEHYPLSTYAHNRYSANQSPPNNYRTRSRYPSPAPEPSQSSYDDYTDSNDWPRTGYGSAFPTSYPSASYDNGPAINNNPSCHSLVDQQYPLFSDVCGAVPQARYSLPNAFGHRERWQIAQILTALVGASTDPTCTRSLRLLVCPVFFPPCPSRHEPAPVLPCQSYCRAVKARCAIPALDLLPCEALPYSSDLCPTGQGYGSFAPPGAFPSLGQPSPLIGGFPSPNFPTVRSFGPQGPVPQGYPSPLSLFGGGQYGGDSISQMLGGDYQSRAFGPQATPPQGYSSPLGLFNGGQYGGDSISQMLGGDYQSRAFGPQAASQQGYQSPLNLYNGGQYGGDSISQMLGGDYSSRPSSNDYWQASRYAPLTRSSTEQRPSNEQRSSAVKA